MQRLGVNIVAPRRSEKLRGYLWTPHGAAMFSRHRGLGYQAGFAASLVYTKHRRGFPNTPADHRGHFEKIGALIQVQNGTTRSVPRSRRRRQISAANSDRFAGGVARIISIAALGSIGPSPFMLRTAVSH